MTNRFWTLVVSSSLSATVAWGAIQTVDTTGWTGDGTSKVEVGGEWRWKNLGAPFADGAARFVDGASITSPRWPKAEILSAAITLRCSTCSPDRFLTISFLKDDTVISIPTKVLQVGRENIPETQTFAVSRKKQANGVRISLGTGTTGDWGVYQLTIACAGEMTAIRQGLSIIIK